jgi:hypothetical protein
MTTLAKIPDYNTDDTQMLKTFLDDNPDGNLQDKN